MVETGLLSKRVDHVDIYRITDYVVELRKATEAEKRRRGVRMIDYE